MPSIDKQAAVEKLAQAVEQAFPADVAIYYNELHPEGDLDRSVTAAELAGVVRGGLAPEDIVDLWNVVFPKDRHVWFNEEDQSVYYNEQLAEYAD